MIVGYDFDGVGYVFGASVSKTLDYLGLDVPSATDTFCKNWNFYEFWKMTREQFAEYCDIGVDLGIVFGPGEGLTRPGFADSIRAVKEAGHTVIGVTHRYQGSPGKAQENTFEWLESENIRHLFDEVHFTHDKTSVHTDVFVEDNRDNYDALRAAGVNAYLINRPWNDPKIDGRQRITDITDYTRLILRYGDKLSNLSEMSTQ